MNLLTDILFFIVRRALQKEAVRQVREKSVLFYLKVLQVARKSLIGAVLVFAAFQLMVIGFVGVVVSGVLLIPQDLDTKLWILLGTFGVLFTLPLGLLIYALSERTWFKASGANELVQHQDFTK